MKDQDDVIEIDNLKKQNIIMQEALCRLIVEHGEDMCIYTIATQALKECEKGKKEKVK